MPPMRRGFVSAPAVPLVVRINVPRRILSSVEEQTGQMTATVEEHDGATVMSRMCIAP